jgi:hypothetical protein
MADNEMSPVAEGVRAKLPDGVLEGLIGRLNRIKKPDRALDFDVALALGYTRENLFADDPAEEPEWEWTTPDGAFSGTANIIVPAFTDGYPARFEARQALRALSPSIAGEG